jgi:heme-degrading monooxygenase HmoA
MQRVRFSITERLREIQNRFCGCAVPLKSLPGFLHLTWWTHPQDPTWHNEVSFWTSYEALNDWHMNTYHKHAKEWAVRSGAIMEDIITNFEFKRARLIRVCLTCANIQDKPFDLHIEQAVLAEPCPKCEYHFPHDARSTRQHGHVQGRARAGGAPSAYLICAPAVSRSRVAGVSRGKPVRFPA